MLPASRAQEVQFAAVVREQSEAPSTTASNVWNLEIGEVFPLVRYISQSEYAGGQPVADDHTYSLLKIADCLIIARTENLALVPQSDIATAAQTHRKIVEDYKAMLARVAQRDQPRPQVHYRAAVDPAENAYLQRKAQAMEAGASQAELNQIEALNEMRMMREEITRMRRMQFLRDSKGGGYQFD